MSGYSSLLSPIMEAASGLIRTDALNVEAQLALASAVVANERLDVLEPIALKAVSDVYTGLPTTNMIINGDIECNELTYSTLNPPVSGVSQNISQVLTNGNDAEFKSITNLNTISCNVVQATNSEGTSLSKFNNFEVFSDNGSTRTATFNAAGNSAVQNYYLYGVQPTDFAITHDKNILTTGNITCNQLNYSTLNPSISSEWVGTATSILDMSDYAIQNTPSVGFKNGVYTGIVSMTPSGKIDFETMGITNITDINCDSVNATTSVSANDIIVAGNIDTASLTVKNPGSGDTVASIDGGGTITSTSLNITTTQFGTTAVIESNGDISCGAVNTVSVPFKPTYDYYVSKGGSDSSLYGSILSPYLTIQQAINVCQNEIDGFPRVIHVSAGSYSENLLISQSRISIKGEGVGSHPDTGSSINGNITVTLATGNADLNNNNITLSGFLIVGTVEDNTTLDLPHRIILDSCHLYGNDRVLYIHPVFDYRVFVSNCVISNDSLVATDPLVQCSGTGMVSFTQNQMTAKGASQMVFKLSGTCRIDLFAQNVLTSDSIGTNVAVAIFNHNSTQTITLGQNAFVYANSGAKRNAETASGVFLNNTGSLVLLSNTFSLSGLASSQMAVYSTSLSFPSTIIVYGANISTSNSLALTATGISGSQGTTKVATLSVQ